MYRYFKQKKMKDLSESLVKTINPKYRQFDFLLKHRSQLITDNLRFTRLIDTKFDNTVQNAVTIVVTFPFQVTLKFYFAVTSEHI